MPQSFAEVVALFDKHREALIRSHLWSHLHLVHFEPGRIEFRPAEGAPRDLANRLGQLLSEWTGIALGRSRSPRPRASRPCASRRSGATRDLRNEVAQPPVGSGGARDLSRGHDRRGPGAVRGGGARGGRASLGRIPRTKPSTEEDGV